MSYLVPFYAVVLIGLTLTFAIAAAFGGRAAIHHFGTWARRAVDPRSPVAGYIVPHAVLIIALVLVIVAVRWGA